jgi:hypothetical protein
MYPNPTGSSGHPGKNNGLVGGLASEVEGNYVRFTKAKSVCLSDEGARLSEELLQKLFAVK